MKQERLTKDTTVLRDSWRDVVKKKRSAREAATKMHSSIAKGSVELQKAITGVSSIEFLSKKLKAGEFTATEVAEAYIAKAITAHEKTNCLTEILFQDAIQRAIELDAFYAKHGEVVGPLHGIPITLKDQFDVKGYDSTLGYVGRPFQPAAEDAVLVHILKNLGAVILAKTNLPQSIMWCETSNPLWGLTTNPRDADFTPGGSTGGEGAVLALGGSIVGWGTDIGGSIRIPSLMNGLYGLKPTSARFPYQGVPVSTEGQEHVPSAIGPMSRSLSSVISITRAVIDAQPWIHDPRVVPIPWRENIFQEVQSRPLIIGVMYDDGVVRVHPPIERVLREIVKKLTEAGHEIFEWKSTLHTEAIAIMDEYYTADGGEDIRRAVQDGGEPFIPHVEKLINKGQPISVYEYWQISKRKIAIQKAYMEKWNAAKGTISGKVADVLLTPTMPHVAVPHDSCRWVGYTKIWNLLDYTALAVPVSKVSSNKDTLALEMYQPRNDLDAWNWDLYNPRRMDGHPVGLQIVGRRFEEEKVLGIAKVLSAL